MKTILLIDDDEDEFLIFSEVLGVLSMPLKCIYLGDAPAALLWLQNNPADFIFIDLIMPKLSGIDLMKQMMDLHLTAESKFVILSTYISPALFEKAMQSGATACIQKPDTVTAMADTMRLFFKDYQL